MDKNKDKQYSRETAIEQLKSDLIDELPPNAQISKVVFEGPFVVLYSLNPTALMENGDIVKSLAKSLRKRIVIRSDVSVRRVKDEAQARMLEIVPENAEITNMFFDDELGEVIIEAKKPGAVIGRSGATLREIYREISWRPKVVRSPPIQSQLINSIRNTLTAESEKRKHALINIGKRIHRPKVIPDSYIRLTGLGGFSEVGRSCLLLETAESKVLIDCGINVGSREPNQMFPHFNIAEFDIAEIDAVLVTHAHLDHCLPPNTPIKLADGKWEHIADVNEGDLVRSLNWKTGKFETATCIGKTVSYGHKSSIEIKTPYLNIISSPNHRFFSVENMEVSEIEAQDLQRDTLLPIMKGTNNDNNDENIELDRNFEFFGTFPLTEKMKKAFQEHRLRKNLKQSDVARNVGIYPNAISLIENNQENITFPVLNKLLELYDINFEDFVFEYNLPNLPKVLTSDLAKLVGYIQGDGHKSTDYSFRITESDKTVVDSYSKLIQQLFRIEPIIRTRKDTNTPTFTIEVNSSYILRFLERNFESVFSKSKNISIPKNIELSSYKILSSYIKGLFDAEGSVIISSSQVIKFCSYSPILLKRIQNLLYRFGISSSLYQEGNELKISSKQSIVNFSESIGFSSIDKGSKLEILVNNSISRKKYHLKDLIPISSADIGKILKKIGVIGNIHGSPRIIDLPFSIVDFYRRGSGYATRSTINDLIEVLSQRYNHLASLREDINENILYIRQQLSIPRSEVASSTGLSLMQIQYREERPNLDDKNTDLIKSFILNQIIEIQEYLDIILEKIKYLLSIDVEWQRIVRIERKENKIPLIDLEVFPNRNFIANNIIVHNSGLVPFLFKWGYRGPVYSNDATLSLMTLLQKDYIDVAEREGKLVPYNQRDIKQMILHTITRRYWEVTDLSNDIRLTMTPAGHILGSSIIHLHIGDGKYNLAIANDFKGKRKRSPTQLLDRANTRFPRLEAMVLESTYGGPRDNTPRREDAERQLIKIINRTTSRGGKVLIPSLAVGRAQELMVVLAHYYKRREMIDVPVYLDGLIAEATAIHSCHPEYLSAHLQDQIFNEGNNPFLCEIFKTVSGQGERKSITGGSPSVIMATSGMLTGGNSVEYFRQLAEDDRNSIVFVSYQAEGTLGRRISSGVKEIRSIDDGRMNMMRVDMDIHQIDGFSGHSDRNEIMNFFRELSPKPERVILIHGQRNKSQSLAQAIGKRYHVKTDVPMNLETLRLN